MYPYLFRWGPLSVTSYGVLLALAFLVSVGLARRATSRALRGVVPMTDLELMDWGAWTVAGGILGGRALYVLLNWDSYAGQPFEIIAIWHGGLVWYGGFFGGLAATWLYLRSRGHGFLRGVDQVIPFVAIGHAIGRLGCFANGCCYGKPTSAWFGVRFPGHPTPVVPTQLFESAGLVVLFLVLRKLQTPFTPPFPQRLPHRREALHSPSEDDADDQSRHQERAGFMLRRPGALLGTYLIGYALLRGTIERWRGDALLVWDGLTFSQCISMLLLVIGLWLIRKGTEVSGTSPARKVSGTSRG